MQISVTAGRKPSRQFVKYRWFIDFTPISSKSNVIFQNCCILPVLSQLRILVQSIDALNAFLGCLKSILRSIVQNSVQNQHKDCCKSLYPQNFAWIRILSLSFFKPSDHQSIQNHSSWNYLWTPQWRSEKGEIFSFSFFLKAHFNSTKPKSKCNTKFNWLLLTHIQLVESSW